VKTVSEVGLDTTGFCSLHCHTIEQKDSGTPFEVVDTKAEACQEGMKTLVEGLRSLGKRNNGGLCSKDWVEP
jgi:hypothetical protein